MIKEFILDCMALGAVCKHDSEGDNASAQHNSIVYIDDCDYDHTSPKSDCADYEDDYDKDWESMHGIDDYMNRLPRLRSELHDIEVKYSQCLISPNPDSNECHSILDAMRRKISVYAIAADCSAHNLLQENLNETLHDIQSRFDKYCEINDKQHGIKRSDSVLRNCECSNMKFAITRMKEQYQKKFNQWF